MSKQFNKYLTLHVDNSISKQQKWRTCDFPVWKKERNTLFLFIMRTPPAKWRIYVKSSALCTSNGYFTYGYLWWFSSSGPTGPLRQTLHFLPPNIRWSRDSLIECLICNCWKIGLDFSNIYPAYSWMYLVSGRLLLYLVVCSIFLIPIMWMNTFSCLILHVDELSCSS